MATGATTGTKILLGRDFRTGYKIVDRLGMQAELVPHMLGSNRLPLGVRGLYCYWRTGASGRQERVQVPGSQVGRAGAAPRQRPIMRRPCADSAAAPALGRCVTA